MSRLFQAFLIFLGFYSVVAIYTKEEVQNVFDDLQAIPPAAEHSLNKLLIKDFFALAKLDVPQSLVSNDGLAYAASPQGYSDLEDHQVQALASASEMVMSVVDATPPGPLPVQPDHTGLSQSCSDKLCYMMEYLLSCKGIGLGVKKICSRYLLGSFYSCSQFPHYSDSIYNAPSICLKEYVTLFSNILTGAKGMNTNLQEIIGDYLFVNYSTNACERRCYQRYQNYSNDFYLNCQLEVQKYNKSYPFPALLANYQQFRNQGCAYNTQNQNCFVKISQTFAKIQYANKTIFHGGANAPDIMNNYYCNYNATNPTYNQQVLAKSCQALSSLGCCAGSGIALVQLNQIEAAKGKINIFPPCFLNYIKDSCQTVRLNDFCVPGTIATQTAMQVYFTVQRTSTNMKYYPYVYQKPSILQTQAILTTLLGALGFSKGPYYLNKNYPFNIYLVGYDYYNGNTKLTPSTGVPSNPPGSDYLSSTYGNFTFQIVLQNLNSTQAQKLQSIIYSPYFTLALSYAFQSPTVTAGISSTAAVYAADPLPIVHSAAPRQFFVNLLPLCVVVIFVKLRLLSEQ